MRDIALFIFGAALGVAFVFGSAWAPQEIETRTASAFVAPLAKPATPAALPFETQIRSDAVPTVRLLKGANGSCSAVVIATGYAVTALHCKEAVDGKVDGHPIAKWTEFSTKDIAVVEVPGLICPCATPGKKALAGERVAALGFPYGVGLSTRYGWTDGDITYQDEVYAHHTAFTDPGMSGGGVFTVRKGRVVLVAITSKNAGNSALSVTVEGVPLRPAEVEG
jgi:hypothetical protein